MDQIPGLVWLLIYLIGLSVSATASWHWLDAGNNNDGSSTMPLVIFALMSWLGVAMLLFGYITKKIINRLP